MNNLSTPYPSQDFSAQEGYRASPLDSRYISYEYYMEMKQNDADAFDSLFPAFIDTNARYRQLAAVADMIFASKAPVYPVITSDPIEIEETEVTQEAPLSEDSQRIDHQSVDSINNREEIEGIKSQEDSHICERIKRTYSNRYPSIMLGRGMPFRDFEPISVKRRKIEGQVRAQVPAFTSSSAKLQHLTRHRVSAVPPGRRLPSRKPSELV